MVLPFRVHTYQTGIYPQMDMQPNPITYYHVSL